MENNPKLEFDHSVHYVNDLDRVTETFQAHGVNVFHGGSHKLWGTHNALSYFGLTYLEFISVEEWEVAKNPPEPILLRRGL
ncbi:VOC family protein [Salipaludibacillus aurantiacus]|uniref:Glyoxalase-like domain-containing protein n=1 Tax=Salipaludibacillus aurantiacus TaxID=1601833 RepID=A0A1H9X508_9BACI|nr:VOC family protein [Salipaludibacillus aurantiacus]SES41232.1 Glyoxalase-like domain-containing protein [Salipaludibacillus aurantiacus]